MPQADFTDSQVQQAFAERTWLQTAPFAYGRYLVRGRGGMYFDVSNITVAAMTTRAQIDAPARYVVIDDPIIPAAIVERMHMYDPEREVFYVFDTGQGLSTVFGRVFNQPSPRELYEQQQGR